VRLAGIGNGADDEKVCKGSNVTKIEDAEINGFPGFGSPSGDKPVWQIFGCGGQLGGVETAC
jgi:hypothetical protein